MGEQVANNTETQYRTSLVEKDGKYYAVTDPNSKKGTIRKEYKPYGTTIVYPKSWGMKKGSMELVEHLISDQEKLIKSSQERLENLKKLYSEISEWREKK